MLDDAPLVASPRISEPRDVHFDLASASAGSGGADDPRRSAQRRRVSSRPSRVDAVPLNRCVSVRKSGSTNMSMKPTCERGTSGFASHPNDTLSPRCSSSSPCCRNSLRTRIAHFSDTANGRHDAPMSAAWTTVETSSSRSASLAAAFGASPSKMRWFSALRCDMWCAMSVPSTMASTALRNFPASASLSFAVMSSRASCSSWNAALTWWFSSTDRSLYRIATGSRMLDRNAFVRPGCW